MCTYKCTTDGRRVYFAAPVTTYPTPHYDRLLARARECFPGTELLSPRELFSNNADWRARWPDILRTLSAVVFIADPDRWIGAGVWQETRDAEAAGIPVLHLTDDGELWPLRTVRLDATRPESARRFARVALRKRRDGIAVGG